VAHLIERADVGMVQRRNGAGLAVEALLGLVVFRSMRGENFDGDGAVETAVACTIDLAHAAST
jgi:hypothetical protein